MGMNILLVDDEAGIRKVVGITLADMGHTVHLAANGDEALEVFRRERPSVVLTDIRMPGMDGLELLRRIKDESPDTEVILVTGHGDMDVAVQGLKLDACDFIAKPAGPEVLEIALKRAADKIAMRQRMREHTENLEALVRQQSEKLVELGRQSAAKEAVEGLTQAMGGLAGEVAGEFAMFNALPCLVSIQDRDQRVVSVNALYRERLGDRVGQPGFAIYAGAAGEGLDSPVARTLRTGKGQKSREGLFGPDETLAAVTVHTAPIHGANGQVDLVLEILVEASEVQRLQDELHTTRQRYQQLFDEAPCFITVQDRHLRIQAANRRFRQEFGASAGSLCYQAYCGTERPCFGCPTIKTFEDGQPHQSELTVRGKDGQVMNVVVWTAPIRNALGEIEGVMEMATDITELARMQDHLASLGMLIASLSHGIKGLLTALDGGVYKVNAGFRSGNQEMVQSGWDKVTGLIGRIKGMVLDILFYAKKRELQLRTMQAAELAAQVAEAVAPKAEGLGVDLSVEIAPDLGEFAVDEVVLSAALVNILENAVDACLEDKTKAAHSVCFRARPDASGVFFEIEDNGCGMQPDTLARLFSVFFSTKGSRGTGLGLFIAKKAVDQHGGRIGAVSEPGQGSTFRIWVPREQ
ncbi:MAG TPA: response regulator [Humidesulfovibrio sp.]|uniref:hybrid sensor histidine kinase/response regulator n=1 Tax=Humidesulfovibrio sp. TaxID=2910988 RepID=UPI002D101EC6|nr:response regulator [Humidesulfovibrio sp.]HWR04200.1 response regulator [Humidesulfovibrio sp.]